ncbi:MAG: rRNA pseudouridine synthase [Candidatus Zixiibacteriota bacterium]|nr:MAG: rRNA pseudouridine synthase [candidate division Zixibacteria bacterium]
MIRLNKYLSQCGVTSRRGAEALITAGRVSVNGRRVDTVGTVIDEETDTVTVDGSVVTPAERKIYVVFNKPPGVITTLDDPFGRKSIANYLKDVPERVYPVGRLDLDTQGVLLLTNDGDLAYRLAHPKYQVEKVYDVRVAGLFTQAAADRIGSGISLEDGATGRATVRIVSSSDDASRLRMTLTEGRKREVKQLCRAVGHPVKQLRRVRFGGISARGLKLGKWRYLSDEEVSELRKLVKLDRDHRE